MKYKLEMLKNMSILTRSNKTPFIIKIADSNSAILIKGVFYFSLIKVSFAQKAVYTSYIFHWHAAMQVQTFRLQYQERHS